MKVRTDALRGKALDWAVARVLGESPGAAYSSDWGKGGPLLERCPELLFFRDEPNHLTLWESSMLTAPMLEAAMRILVAASLGDEVDVPEALLR